MADPPSLRGEIALLRRSCELFLAWLSVRQAPGAVAELAAPGWVPDPSFVATESVTCCRFATDRPFDEWGKAVTAPHLGSKQRCSRALLASRVSSGWAQQHIGPTSPLWPPAAVQFIRGSFHILRFISIAAPLGGFPLRTLRRCQQLVWLSQRQVLLASDA